MKNIESPNKVFVLIKLIVQNFIDLLLTFLMIIVIISTIVFLSASLAIATGYMVSTVFPITLGQASVICSIMLVIIAIALFTRTKYEDNRSDDEIINHRNFWLKRIIRTIDERVIEIEPNEEVVGKKSTHRKRNKK